MPQHAPIQRGFNYIDWAHALPVCAELKNRLVEMAYLAGGVGREPIAARHKLRQLVDMGPEELQTLWGSTPPELRK